jgi:uncharacterized protein involved in exopolysaccharide biosynthesis
MIKLLETIFRHLILLLLILLVPVIIGVGVGYTIPPSYQASATLWALQRYQIVDGGGAGSSQAVTPADTQAAALTELLKSSAFDIAVGKSTDLKSTFRAEDVATANALNDAYVADISKNVKVTTQGTNLYQISYTNRDPRVAAQVVKAVMAQFQTQGQPFSVIQGQTYSIIEAQHLLQANQGQLTKAQSAAASAAKDEAIYLQQHPTATLNDPQYAVLNAQRQQAQTTVTNLQTTIATLNQQIAAAQSTGLFKTLDPPEGPPAVSRSKLLLTTGGVGAAVGLIICIVYILILVRRDRAFYTVLDVQKVTSYPILMQVPQLPREIKEFVVSGSTQH